MRFYRNYLLSLLGSLILLLAGAVGQQPPTRPPARPAPLSPPPAKPAPPAKTDPAATRVLDEAIQGLEPKIVSTVETEIWQQEDIQGVAFQADGSYLLAPDNRLHLKLNVLFGGTRGSMEMVCDGKTLWEAIQIGASPRIVSRKVDVSQVQEALKGKKEGEQVRQEWFQEQCIAGLLPLLKSIRERMVVTGQQKVRRGSREMIKLTAVWSPDVTRALLGPNAQWPAYLPRQCYLYLGQTGAKKTLWPFRIEWWGPTTGSRPEDILIWQLEFRKPKLNQPLPADRLAKEFKFDPGSVEVPDVTQKAVESVKLQAEQLAAQKKGK